MRLLMPFVLVAAFVLPAQAAINPAEFTRGVPDQMRIRETARIVQETRVGDSVLRRVTLVGEVVEQKNMTGMRVGDSVVIDFTVDLTARARGAAAHSERNGTRPGPQYMQEPDPPVLDAEGMFWANLAPVGSEGINREAGAVVDAAGDTRTGAVFVPVSGQYSFDEPVN